MRAYSKIVGFALVAVLGGCAAGAVEDDLSGLGIVDGDNEGTALSSAVPQVKVVATLAYGETSGVIAYTSQPKYRGVKFSGEVGDEVNVEVRTARQAVAYLIDAKANVVAVGEMRTGMTTLAATLPGNALKSDKTYYVIFRDSALARASFQVSLEGAAAGEACRVDADCKAFGEGAVTDDAALCVAGRCEMVDPNVIVCGGLSPNSHVCPTGYFCSGPDVPVDGVGVCRKLCGGLRATACDSGFECVDDADDSCDPQNGGRDCHGLCQPKTCGGLGHLGCASGLECIDDTTDDCDVERGGRDCSGLCVKP